MISSNDPEENLNVAGDPGANEQSMGRPCASGWAVNLFGARPMTVPIMRSQIDDEPVRAPRPNLGFDARNTRWRGAPLLVLLLLVIQGVMVALLRKSA